MKLNTQQLFEIFPEGLEFVLDIQKQYEEYTKEILDLPIPPFAKWFWLEIKRQQWAYPLKLKHKQQQKHIPYKIDKDRINEIPIENMVDTPVNRSGKTTCPFHVERTPSFTIYKDNTFHCFGCGVGGDAIKFIMLQNNCDFKTALQIGESYAR